MKQATRAAIRASAKACDCEREAILNLSDHTRRTVRARRLVIAALRMSGMTSAEIGRELGTTKWLADWHYRFARLHPDVALDRVAQAVL